MNGNILRNGLPLVGDRYVKPVPVLADGYTYVTPLIIMSYCIDHYVVYDSLKLGPVKIKEDTLIRNINIHAHTGRLRIGVETGRAFPDHFTDICFFLLQLKSFGIKPCIIKKQLDKVIHPS